MILLQIRSTEEEPSGGGDGGSRENSIEDGNIICNVTADDPDQGKNGKIRYYIKDNGRNVLETKKHFPSTVKMDNCD
ncbi:hypothetical protein CHUAL_013473 [Chamberlinius hualienensis]